MFTSYRDESTLSWFNELILHLARMTSSANLIPSREKQAQSLAEEMNKAECHMAYTWLSEQCLPAADRLRGGGCIQSSLKE